MVAGLNLMGTPQMKDAPPNSPPEGERVAPGSWNIREGQVGFFDSKPRPALKMTILGRISPRPREPSLTKASFLINMAFTIPLSGLLTSER